MSCSGWIDNNTKEELSEGSKFMVYIVLKILALSVYCIALSSSFSSNFCVSFRRVGTFTFNLTS